MVSPSLHNSITKLSEQSQIPGSNDPTPFSLPHGSAVTLTLLGSAGGAGTGASLAEIIPEKWSWVWDWPCTAPGARLGALDEQQPWTTSVQSWPQLLLGCALRVLLSELL